MTHSPPHITPSRMDVVARPATCSSRDAEHDAPSATHARPDADAPPALLDAPIATPEPRARPGDVQGRVVCAAGPSLASAP